MKQDKCMEVSIEQKFSIFRSCRSKKKCEQISLESKKYGIKKDFFWSNLSYFEIVSKVIETCEDDFALICHDDVVLPMDIVYRVDLAVRNAEKEVGENWGIIGNFGKEFLSHKKTKLLKDLNPSIIVGSSAGCRPVISIDDNLILLNLKAIRMKSVQIPELMLDSNICANIILIECYLKGLICFIDSNLFVFHKDFENTIAFDKKKNEFEQFSRYWSNLFINHVFITNSRVINIENNVNYLMQNNEDKRVDLYKRMELLILDALAKNIEINIIIRSRLNRLNYLKRSLELIKAGSLYNKSRVKINVIISANNVVIENHVEVLDSLKKEYNGYFNINCIISSKESVLYPRVQSIKDAIEVIDNKDSFVWIVDDDDFILPNIIKYFPSLLKQRQIFIGNSIIFEEKWDKDEAYTVPLYSRKKKVMNGEKYYEVISGSNNIPVCSVIYPTSTLLDVFSQNNLKGDYAEDYTIFLLALKNNKINQYPLSIAGISFHGDNTVLEENRTHWDYSYATFMSEVVNAEIMPEWTYDYIEKIKEEREGSVRQYVSFNSLYKIIKGFYFGKYDELIKKAYNVLRKKGLKKFIKFSFAYHKNGRRYFKDGMNAIDEYLENKK